MTIGPAVGNKHVDGKHHPFQSWCQTPPEVGQAQLKALLATKHAYAQSGPEKGKVMIDTASAYQNSFTEQVLGDIISQEPEEVRAKISIHTKANPLQEPYKCFSKKSILHQANNSLASLKVSTIDVYYLHHPDFVTDIEEALDAIEELHKEGKIREFGLSNYPAWKVVDIWHRCKARGMVRPTVYQGCYNALTRTIEFEATAAFRELGIRSYHYNPLAGGLLTGKYDAMDSEGKDSGRFGKESPIGGALYSARYWKQSYFDALELVRAACKKENILMSDAALRWCLHHSILSGDHHDAIILGASSLEHCTHNLEACAAGPLPDSLVEAFARAWEISRFAAAPYFFSRPPALPAK